MDINDAIKELRDDIRAHNDEAIQPIKERLASLDPASPEVKHLHRRCEAMETQLTATKQGVERVLDEGLRTRRAARE